MSTLRGLYSIIQNFNYKKCNNLNGSKSDLSLDMARVSKKLAKYLVKRVNVKNASLRLEQDTINIVEEDVNRF